ncbi:MAG: hypothetical protein HC822_21120 [Oscillochloris sp.]|nr:hypothetical protein [Oscillochloris sp.]
MQSQRVVFIVRMWKTPPEQGQPQLRGSIEAVPDGNRRYFGSIDELCALLQLAVTDLDTANEEES